MKSFKGVKLGCAFAEAFLELSCALLGFFDRAARQAIRDALIVRQYNRANLNIEVISLLAIERVLDLAGNRDRHGGSGWVEIRYIEDPYRQLVVFRTPH